MRPGSENRVPRNHEVLVTTVATDLMAVTSATSVEVSRRVMGDLVSYFDVDVSFLRHNDHRIRASELVAEWPPRPATAGPDPLKIVYFSDSDPLFAETEHLDAPTILRAEPPPEIDSRGPATVAEVPLRSGEVTTGVLGFVKFGDRVWEQEELNALEAIASLFAQVQARIAAEDRLRYLAEHDDLTGLYNRRALLTHLDRRLAAGAPGPVAVLFFDLDRLKAVNDYLGHIAGDWFIRILAERLQQGEEEKFVARLGGDEFVVVPTAPMTVDAAETLAHRLQSVLRERVSIDGEMLTRTISIGVAVGRPGCDDTSDLLSRADQAVLTAKGAGGNCIRVFSEGMSQEIALRNDIELHLQNVIDSGSLILHYLPEVDIRTGEILATEALVRWQHPTRGLLPPDRFIGVAESINLAGDLGRWVLRNACAEFGGWGAAGV
ncbi:diguanylate cyclase domain-containing protein, partial [Mycobacterium sp. GA-2829]|uniref:diguanylate cyclase domain-containing protein n=1 Tax=Mycobacterium sp. GA-2829 TaxID=1772283 RepID=UPI000B157D16